MNGAASSSVQACLSAAVMRAPSFVAYPCRPARIERLPSGASDFGARVPCADGNHEPGLVGHSGSRANGTPVTYFRSSAHEVFSAGFRRATSGQDLGGLAIRAMPSHMDILSVRSTARLTAGCVLSPLGGECFPSGPAAGRRGLLRHERVLNRSRRTRSAVAGI